MNKQKWIILLVALAMIGGMAVTLNRLKANQKLGSPGIKTASIPGSRRLNVYLPPTVLDYNSEVVPTDTNVLNGLPHDTSFAQRRYMSSSESAWLLLNVVLMGADRSSIHKPQFCLTGSGWDIDGRKSSPDALRIQSPYPYDLPVMKLITTKEGVYQGQKIIMRGIYVYWFVADHQLTGDHWVRMRSMATHLLRTGELQRWAYVSCFAVCLPGQEDMTYERMKKFIAASVPEFQLATGTPIEAGASTQAALK